MHFFLVSLSALGLISLALTLPVAHRAPTTIESTLVSRQSITTPVGVNVTDIDAGDISPIEDGFLELDSDSGGETNSSGTAVSVANGVGTVGSGQSASNGNGNEGSSSACGMV